MNKSISVGIISIILTIVLSHLNDIQKRIFYFYMSLSYVYIC